MLRGQNTSWNSEYRNSRNIGHADCNNLMTSGEFTMELGEDFNAPTPLAGSNYWLTQRLLYKGVTDVHPHEWISQVAYSYVVPCIGVRLKYGMNMGTESLRNTWTPWEYTVMSGVITHQIKYENGTVTFQQNRNSSVVNIGFYNVSIPIDLTDLNGIYIGNVPKSFRPKKNVGYTIRITANDGKDYPGLINVLTDGSVYVRHRGIAGSVRDQSVLYFLTELF